MAKSTGRHRATSRTNRARPVDENLHSGGTRGTSRLGGPQEDPGDGEEDPRVRADADEGSRSTLGRPDPEGRTAGENPRAAEPPRGPLPPGAEREDYVGGARPHKTRQKGGKPGASGRRNEVI